jgi:hypothetical protein
MTLGRVFKPVRSLFMKLSGLCLTALIATLSCGGLSAETEKSHQGKKLYVDGQAVAVTKDGILVKTQAGNLIVRVLRSDEKGVFILKRDVRCASKGCSPNRYRYIRCECGAEFSNEADYWKHVNSGRCPFYR